MKVNVDVSAVKNELSRDVYMVLSHSRMHPGSISIVGAME